MRRAAFNTIFIVTVLFCLNPSVVFSDPLEKKPAPSAGVYHPKRITSKPKPSPDKPFAEHFVIFHIAAGDAYAQRLVLNNATNMMNYYGEENVDIEIVAYGAGLRILFKENSQAQRIQGMADRGIKFSACAATMKGMGRPKESLHSVAKVVAGGVIRIVELQEAGWTYIRP